MLDCKKYALLQLIDVNCIYVQKPLFAHSFSLMKHDVINEFVFTTRYNSKLTLFGIFFLTYSLVMKFESNMEWTMRLLKH